VEHIIAKLDNDFNIDHGDWIPRVGAWIIDAMGQLNVLRKKRSKIKLDVHNCIAYSNCPINSPNLIVTDSNGCPIVKHKSNASGCCSSSTGEVTKLGDVTPSTVDAIYNPNAAYVPDHTVAETVNGSNKPPRYNIVNYDNSGGQPRNYVLLDDNKLELNFNTSCVYVETDVVETVWSKTYECDIPVVPNVGILIEAIGFYCMYKMLTRGYKHPVFNLNASQYGTNPYYEWKTLKPEAKRAVTIDAQGNILVTDGGLFKSSFFITTFPNSK